MTLEDVILAALVERGVLRVRKLNQREIDEVAKIERNFSAGKFQWGKPVNVGVFECLSKKHVFAALTRPDFQWPAGPYALLKVGEREVGVIDERGVLVNRHALAEARGEHVVLLLPLKLPELDEIVKSCVAASPSPRAHTYLLSLFGSSCGSCGTLLVGFDDLKVSKRKNLKENTVGQREYNQVCSG